MAPRKDAASAKVGNAALATTGDTAYTKLTHEITFLRFGLNKTGIALWVLFSVLVIAVDVAATWFYFQFHQQKKYGWSGIYVATGLTKLFIKWVVIREKKLMLSYGNQLCNVIEYRIGVLRYYDVYVGRVIVNFPFDWMTVIIMTTSVVHMYTFFVQYPCTAFEFINSLFCYTFFSSLLLTYNKTEAIKQTFGKLWWLYLSYFTFENPPVAVSALYVLIFAVTNIVFQTRVVMNYFGFPSVQEYALVRSDGYRHSALKDTGDASRFCVGFDKRDRYCVAPAKQFQELTDPRFFRTDDMQDPVSTFDIWKLLQAIECPRYLHQHHDIADLFKYLRPNALGDVKRSQRPPSPRPGDSSELVEQKET